jgi:hypothetical protein
VNSCRNSVLFAFLFFSALSHAQIDIIRVVKPEKNTLLFATVLDQIVQARVTRGELCQFGKLAVNDSVAVTSYWITCWSGNAQHQRWEKGEEFSSQTHWDINHIGKGGKIYFTNIIGHNIYTLAEYKIYNLVITITD